MEHWCNPLKDHFRRYHDCGTIRFPSGHSRVVDALPTLAAVQAKSLHTSAEANISYSRRSFDNLLISSPVGVGSIASLHAAGHCCPYRTLYLCMP